MGLSEKQRAIVASWMVIFLAWGLVACSGQRAKRAGQGAATGAVVGAAGGMISALVFGGNVGEAAARGAVWGASTGAVSGAIVGAQENQAQKKQRDAAVAPDRVCYPAPPPPNGPRIAKARVTRAMRPPRDTRSAPGVRTR